MSETIPTPPDDDPPEHEAEVVDLRTRRPRARAIERLQQSLAPETAEETDDDQAGNASSFEHPLDAEPEPGGMSVDLSGTVAEMPVIPASLQGWANIKHTAEQVAKRTWHRLAYHAVRAPKYALASIFYAPRGLLKLIRRQIGWWWLSEQHQLRMAAADNNDPAEWLRLHRELRQVRGWRGFVVGVEALGVASLLTAMGLHAVPAVYGVAIVAVALPALARFGRPIDKPILTPATVAGRMRVINADVVLRAYYAAKLGNPDKPGEQITFGSPMSREGEGSRVVVDLPFGKTLSDAMKAKEAVASGLDVAISQVDIVRDKSSQRRHTLWVADRDPLATPAGRTPLLRLQPTDIWLPAPMGLDSRGRLVSLDMLWNSILIGAMPRSGKTFTARLLALYAALDPHVQIAVFDGKASPDWRKFALVADAFSFGFVPDRDCADPLEVFIHTLREWKKDVQWRYQRLSELPTDICPEGKLTRDIARDPAFGMPVRLLVLEEFQEYYDTPDVNANKEIAKLLAFMVKVAPAAGYIVEASTQKPSGIGTGTLNNAFTAFRDNFAVRFALRTGSYNVSDTVLGQGAYSEGLDSSTLLPEHKGVGILRGASEANPTVRTFLADGKDAEKILLAARATRVRAGTLSGMAAGADVLREARDVLADARGVYTAGEDFLSWQSLAARLALAMPETYAGTTPDAVSAQLRAFGVPSVNGRDKGLDGVAKGAKAAAVDTAMARRAATR